MKFTTILLGGAALVGLGVYLSRKFGAKHEEDEAAVLYAGEKETYGEKLHKASLFAVGAVKTGADKIVEGIKDIRNQDMIKKGEETIESAKEAAEGFVGDIKSKVGIGVQSDDAPDEIDEGDDFFMAGEVSDDDEEMEF
ncbi:MAG: hypothetical protein FWE60_04180 [Oscillospiraceae bacterium]|nr:hypothetical protein [Oscillospiraceae bacterium]